MIDADTDRGVPLVELETVNGMLFVTDNAGRVAFGEPDLFGREVFFSVRSHGYRMPEDGFGYEGTRVRPRAEEVAEIQIQRRHLAERLCRLTGEGCYRDTVLLGHQVPRPGPENPGRVAGQDSVQAAIYRDHVYWFWGDTQRMSYPLGLFRMAGATTPIPDDDFNPAPGIPFDYFVDGSGFARAMMPLPDRPEGVIWVESIFTLSDETGGEKLLGHYSRRKGLDEEYEQGIAVFNDRDKIFEPAKRLPLDEQWRRPSGHPIEWHEGGTRWLLYGSPTPNVRVPADLEAVLDATQHEALTCADPEQPDQPLLDSAGQPVWRWQRELPPLDSQTEAEWVRSGQLPAESARFCPAEAEDSETRIVLHRGTVRWNRHREQWVMVAGQLGGGPSHLGEIWYAEADEPTGPFSRAVRIVTHDRQTFYNPCHHAFLDREGGRWIHFEGTYTNDFSGNPHKTPRYNYNQVLYRLDVDHPDLRAVFGR